MSWIESLYSDSTNHLSKKQDPIYCQAWHPICERSKWIIVICFIFFHRNLWLIDWLTSYIRIWWCIVFVWSNNDLGIHPHALQRARGNINKSGCFLLFSVSTFSLYSSLSISIFTSFTLKANYWLGLSIHLLKLYLIIKIIIKGFPLCKMTLSTVSLLLRLPSYLIDHSGNNSSLIKTYLDTSWASVNQEKLDVERTPPTPLIGADEETVPLSSCLLRISGNQRLAGLWLPFHCRRCFSCFPTQTPSNTDSPRKP